MRLKERLVEWLARHLPTCKEITRLASDAMERKLPLRQRIDMKMHFLICAACLRYFKQLHFMKEIANQHESQAVEAATPPDTTLASEARARIKRRLDIAS